MADTTTSFSVDIEETGADSAASSLEALKEKILGDSAALKEMTAALRNLKAGGAAGTEVFTDLKAKIDAQKQSIAGAQASFIQLGGSFGAAAGGAGKLTDALDQVDGDLGKIGDESAGGMDGLKDSTDGASASAGDLKGALSEIPGPLGRSTREAGKLLDAFGKLGAAGPYVAAAAVIAIITFAAIAATAAMLHFGISMADAARNAALVTAGVAASSKALSALPGMMAGIQASTGLASDEVNKLAESLAAGGVKAAAMPAALKAMATATAGGATPEFLAKLEAGLKSTGKVLPELQAQMKTFGDLAAEKMLSLDGQAATMKRNMSGTFGGLKIEGLLKAFSSLVALFDSSTASGRAMKTIFEGIFQPMVDGLTKLVPMIQTAFLYAVLYVLKAYNALKPYSGEIKLLAEILGGLLLAAILIVGASIFIAFLPIMIVVGAAVAVIYILIKAVELIGDAFDAIGDALGSAWDGLVGGAETALAWLQGLPAQVASIGGDIISGLVGTITAGVSSVVASVVNMGKAALGALRSIFDSHSPSKAFGRIGETAPQGVVGAVEDGTPDVAHATEKMGSAALAGADAGMGGGSSSKAAGGPSGGARGGVSFHIEKLEVNGVAGADDPSFGSKLAGALEVAVQMLGLQPEHAQ